MSGEVAIRVPAWGLVVALWVHVGVRPLVRKLVEHLNQAVASAVDNSIDRIGNAFAAVVAEWWEKAAPRRSAQPRYVVCLIRRCEAHLALRGVTSHILDTMRGDKDCGAISVIRATVNAIRIERQMLIKLDATYVFAAALLPLAAWGPVYSVATWNAGESSAAMLAAELTLKAGLFLVAVTLGDPARSQRTVRVGLDLAAVGVVLSLVFSAYLGPGWDPWVSTIVYKLSMASGLVAIFAIRRGSTNLTFARWTFALATVAEGIGLRTTTDESLMLAQLVNIALLVLAYRTVRSSPEFYWRLGNRRAQRVSQ